VNAGLSFNASSIASAAATINFTKCQTARWQVCGGWWVVGGVGGGVSVVTCGV
jgi:hypothetical protein